MSISSEQVMLDYQERLNTEAQAIWREIEPRMNSWELLRIREAYVLHHKKAIKKMPELFEKLVSQGILVEIIYLSTYYCPGRLTRLILKEIIEWQDFEQLYGLTLSDADMVANDLILRLHWLKVVGPSFEWTFGHR